MKGCDGSIIPVEVDGKKAYFKFLPQEFKERLEREVRIVKRLKEENCKVPDYYEQDGQVIFEQGEEVYYASYEVPGTPAYLNMNFDLLKEIMVELAKMHKVLRTIPLEGKKESDINRFRKFYEKNKNFFQRQGFSNKIERVLEREYEEEEYSYIHADINFKNIFVENNHITSFIDFTDLRIGYLEDDLGKLFQNILYLDLTDEELEELIKVYEQELGQKVNRKNLLVSILFRIMYRYFGFVKNKEGNIEEYKGKTEQILQKIGG